jgi:hypothetical protein
MPFSITLWVAEQRSIPGPAEAYLRVLQLLPQNLRQVELNRLKQKGTDMRDGMYGISFQGQQVPRKLGAFDDFYVEIQRQVDGPRGDKAASRTGERIKEGIAGPL